MIALNENTSWEEVERYLIWLANSKYSYHIDDAPEDIQWEGYLTPSEIEVLRVNSEIIWKYGEEAIWDVYGRAVENKFI